MIKRPASPPRFGLFVLNLVALIGLGLSLSAWLLIYTEYFPVVGGLLGLGGLFAWIAFLSNLVSNDRKKQLQEAFDNHFLQKSSSLAVMTALTLGFWLIVSARNGTLIFDNLGNDRTRVIEIYAADGEEASIGEPLEKFLLRARSKHKTLLGTDFFSPRRYHVEASGLPAATIEVGALALKTVSLPDEFYARPVVLIRPHAKVSRSAAHGDFRLEIRIVGSGTHTREPKVIEDYAGEAVWLGARAGVEAPLELVRSWRLELLNAGMLIEEADRWSRPQTGPGIELPAGATVRVDLVSKTSGLTTATGSNIIPTNPGVRDFPIQVVLRWSS